MHRMKFSTITLVFFFVLLMDGCANLGAVRDFASSSSRLTDYKGVTERYVTSADRQLADLPADKRFTKTRNNLLELKTVTAQDKKTLLKLHAVTTGYMTALAGLAGKGVYSISGEIDEVSGAIVASEKLKINAEHVQAYSNIVQKVADWTMAAKQAKEVRNMVKHNGADMDKLLEAMQFATEAYGIILEQEAESSLTVAEYRDAQWAAKLPGDTNLTPERREVVAALLRKSSVAERAAQEDALKAQKASAAGLLEVRQAHRSLVDNVDRLNAKDVQALLRKAAADLKSIREGIADL